MNVHGVLSLFDGETAVAISPTPSGTPTPTVKFVVVVIWADAAMLPARNNIMTDFLRDWGYI